MKLAFLPIHLLYGSLCFWFSSCFLVKRESRNFSLLGTSGLLHDDKTFRLFGRHLKLKHRKIKFALFHYYDKKRSRYGVGSCLSRTYAIRVSEFPSFRVYEFTSFRVYAFTCLRSFLLTCFL